MGTPWVRRKKAERARVAVEALRVREGKRKSRAKSRRQEKIKLRAARKLQPSTSIVETLEQYTCSDGFDRAVAIQARKLAYTVNELTCGRGVEFQRAVVERFLDHPLMEEVLPNSVLQRRKLELCQVVCNGLTEAWSSLKYAVGQDQRLARNVIEAAVISTEENQAAEAAIRCVGLNKRAVRRAMIRRHLLNESVEGELWARIDRKKRKDALPQSTIDIVVLWWTNETRVSPSKKDVRKKRVGVKKFLYHAGHWLEESQVHLYQTTSISIACFLGYISVFYFLCFLY